MKFRWEKKYLYWGITAFVVIISSILFFMMLNNAASLTKGIHWLIGILTPFIMAFGFAYILNPVHKWFESLIKRGFEKSKSRREKDRSKLIRGLSTTATVLVAAIVIFGLILMIIPQVTRSIVGIVYSLPQYLKNLEQWLFTMFDGNSEVTAVIDRIFDSTNEDLISWAENNLLPQLNNILSGITVGLLGVVNVIKNIFVSSVLTIYILFSKEKFIGQAKKMLYTVFRVRTANRVLKVGRHANKVVGKFIIGKMIDSAAIGAICFFGMTLFNWISPIDFPFTLLISVVIGVTNIIPFFGPFIGAIPSIVLILMVNPIAALYFAIFVLLLQQFDGNILGPKILGDTTGLSAFWVMFAILIGGGMFGFMGMLVGVPIFAVIYALISEWVTARLKKHEMPVKTEDYLALDYIDEMSYEPLKDTGDDDIKIFNPKGKDEKQS